VTVNNKWALINFLITLSALVLIKDFAIVLALISSVILVVNFLFESKTKTTSKRKSFTSALGLFVAAFSVIFFTRFIWVNFVGGGDFAKNSNAALAGTPERVGSLVNSDREYINLMWDTYKSRFMDGTVTSWGGFQISTFSWIMIIGILALLSTLNFESKDRRKEIAIATSVFFGSFAYLAALFLAYLTVYSGNNALGLTSYERYISTYLSGSIFFISTRAVNELLKFSIIIEKIKFEKVSSQILKLPKLVWMQT
jgi:hypothetical protein